MGERHTIRQRHVWRTVILPLLFTLYFSLFTSSCSDNRQNFLLEGDFKGFNQGELYIYGQDGTHALDTVAVAKGHFRYEIPLEDSTLFVLVFPNFTELPIFGVKGATVKLDGDASHLRETKIKGLKENEEMTRFRRETSQQTPPELAKSVAEFITEHPASPFAIYLLRKYFIQIPQPNYPEAIRLASAILKANPSLHGMGRQIRWMKGLKELKDGGKLPAFTAKDVHGKTVSSADLNAKVNVITVWASWNYESTNIQRRLQTLKERHQNDNDLKIVSICLDPDVKACRRVVDRDSLKWSTVCDGRMWESPVLETLGLAYVPDNIITDSQGKIIGHSLNNRDLFTKVDRLIENH